MGYVTKQQIEKAREMDLLTYLQAYEPNNLRPFGRNGYCLKDHDSLKISNGKWFWWSQNIGGRSALDYLVSVRNVPFTEAVTMLCGNTINMPYQTRKPMEKPKVSFVPPKRYENNNRVTDYLKKRGIDEEIINYCIDNNLLYEEIKYHNAVFVGYNNSSKIAYAFLRSTYLNSTFMGEVGGSDKRYSFSIVPKDSKKEGIAIFESAIDAMSYATMLKMGNKDWKQCRYLSLGGVYKEKNNNRYKFPLALEEYLKNNADTKLVLMCLDNDNIGKNAMEEIAVTLHNTAIRCIFNPPNNQKDYNAVIMAKKHLSNVKTRGNESKEIIR